MAPGPKLPHEGVCEVCKLTSNDETIKMVYWCVFCKAWICEECDGKVVKRAEAAVITAVDTIKKKFCPTCNRNK